VKFQVGATVTPAGSPVAVLGFQTFDGNGNYTARVTINASGTIIHAEAPSNSWSWTEAGKRTPFTRILPREFFLLTLARKQFPGKNNKR
jgi:hypothetical protein